VGLAEKRVVEALPEVESLDERLVMQAGVEFAGINAALFDLPRLPRGKEGLKDRVLSFVALHGTSDDARAQVFVAYLRAMFPDWIPDKTGRTHPYRRNP